MLNIGDDTFQFDGPANAPLAIRDFLLQVAYSTN
jgi:hypothetical protein